MRAAVAQTLVLFLALAGGSVRADADAAASPIQHVVVLMLENRAFDHMLGPLAATRPMVNGCTPDSPGCANFAAPCAAKPG